VKEMVHCFVAASMAAACFIVPVGDAAGQKDQVVDRVVAVVEDKAVLQSELELEYRRVLLQTNRTMLTDEEEKKLRQEILDGLIADLLMTVHATKRGVEVSDEEVDAAVERTINDQKEALGGHEAFTRQVAREGLTMEKLRELYREKLRARMLIESLLYREVMSEVQVAEGEVKDYYRNNLSSLPQRPPTVNVAHIRLKFQISEDAREKALEKAQEIERKVRAGEDFAEVAREYSEGPSAQYGGSLGYVRLADLNNPAFEETAKKLLIGEVSGPVLTEYGYHIIKLEDVRGEEVLVRHILIRVESEEDDIARTAELAERIRQEIIEGADFGEMAARYSSDHATKEQGGVVGEIPLENLPQYFREAIRDVGDNEIAPVLKESDGFRVVKVLGRQPGRPYTFDEARDELKRVIEQQRRQDRFKEYVEGLKDIYHVEVKGAP